MKKPEELDFSKKIEKQELMDILKNEAFQKQLQPNHKRILALYPNYQL
ncbi:MAG: hypothetical protein ABSE83_06410 [Methanobacterium sp.]|jgi:hypothetical protein